jgi:hypothetical protein
VNKDDNRCTLFSQIYTLGKIVVFYFFSPFSELVAGHEWTPNRLKQTTFGIACAIICLLDQETFVSLYITLHA